MSCGTLAKLPDDGRPALGAVCYQSARGYWWSVRVGLSREWSAGRTLVFREAFDETPLSEGAPQTNSGYRNLRPGAVVFPKCQCHALIESG